LVDNFLENNDVVIQVCHNSTGSLVTQLTTDGNPDHFGLFLAANAPAPTLVCGYAAGTCISTSQDLPDNPFTYIEGIPALWSPVLGLINVSTGLINLGAVAMVVIARPSDAPYGLAAQQIMQRITGQWNAAQQKLSVQDNIEQAYAVISNQANNAAGYVALSQICQASEVPPGPPLPYNYRWYEEGPPSGYDPIIQNGAVINIPTSVLPDSNSTAVDFVAFLLDSDEGQNILVDGYCYKAAPSKKSKK
jgi:molybdate transport system substrate-binding protein